MIYTYDSNMAGAPVLSGTAGALRALVKAALVDGFGAGAVATLTVSAGIATATFAGAHPYRIGTPSQIAGATPSGLNGQKRVLSITSSAITFDATGIADGTATGTITHKVAAAGWQELFAGAVTNVLCIKPTVPEATGCVLRIDDTGTTTARARGFESMTSASVGAGPFPTDGQVSGGQNWWKSDVASTAARAWRLFADDRLIYLWVAAGTNTQGRGSLLVFGDINSDKSGDAYSCVINGLASNTSNAALQPGCCGTGQSAAAATADFVLARSHFPIGGAQLAKKVAAHNTGLGASGSTAYNPDLLVFPNGADNSLRLSPVEVMSQSGIRGTLPGLFHSPQVLAGMFSTGSIVEGTGAYAGRTFCALVVGPSTGTVEGVVFVDLGAWR